MARRRANSSQLKRLLPLTGNSRGCFRLFVASPSTAFIHIQRLRLVWKSWADRDGHG